MSERNDERDSVVTYLRKLIALNAVKDESNRSETYRMGTRAACATIAYLAEEIKADAHR